MKDTTSQYMDKQIMDLSNSSPENTNNNSDFIDFMNRPVDDHRDRKGDDILLPSYDFLPIRPSAAAGGSASPPPPPRSLHFDSDEAPPKRTWGSFDSKANSSSVKNYGSLEPGKVSLEKEQRTLDLPLVSEIDRMMKKHADNLLHAMDVVTARLSQLEMRTHNIENLVDDLKVSVGNHHGSSDGKMRHLENIMREVQTGVQVVKDKQEIIEAQLQIAKLQILGTEPEYESDTAAHNPVSVHPQLSTVSVPQPQPSMLPPPNAPPPPPPQQSIPQPAQMPMLMPNQFSQNQAPAAPPQESYFPPPAQNPSQQYQAPPLQQQSPMSPPPPQQQYQPPPPQPHYSQPPPPPLQYQSATPPAPQPQMPVGHHPEEPPYMTYPPSIRPHNTSSGAPPSQQFYGPPSSMYESPPGRPGSGYSSSYGSLSGLGEPHPYSGSPSQYGSSSPRKQHQLSSPPMSQGGGTGYPQLPTARILPHALPTASGVGSGSGSGGTGNRVPIDDVVDKVTTMGFPRDQVRATVRKLTENGQAVDLNIVLDKLMNDGDGQGPRAWFGR